jgi:hypothetical protein
MKQAQSQLNGFSKSVKGIKGKIVGALATIGSGLYIKGGIVQSAELANTLSLNFKQFATSQKDLLEKTTKMMETAAVIASKRGMAMTEVSDRIRSAMNQ